MKKILRLNFILCTLLLSVFLLPSCSSDDDDSNPSSLVNTTWIATGVEDTYSYEFVIRFTSAVNCTLSYSDTDGYTEYFLATYIYDNPKITIMISEESGEGIINGKNLYFGGEIFTRQ